MEVFKSITVSTLASFIISSAIGQRNKYLNFDKKVSVSEVNDMFALQRTDGYYTSGTFFEFSKLKKGNLSGGKTIYSFEIGQKIFTAGIREVYVITEIDRPITGYLYGKFSIHKFNSKNKVYSYGASIGTIGRNAFGKQILDLVHPVGGINSDYWGWIWNYQLKNELGVNFHASFAKSLTDYKSSPFFQLIPKTEMTLGTTFTNVAQSLVFQIGKQNNLIENSYWGSELSNSEVTPGKKEFFFFYHPKILYQVYNATVQGGLFRGDKGGITSSIQPFVVYNEFGVIGSIRRYSASFNLTFQTKEATLQEKNHAFGKVQLAYRFK